MPDLPHIPGKSVVTGTTKRVRLLAAGAGVGVAAAGGFVLKRVLGHGGDTEKGVDADPIAQTVTAPPGPVKPTSVPKPAGSKAPATKPKPVKPKAAKPAVGKPKPSKPKGDKPKPSPKAKPGPKAGPKAKPRPAAKAAPKPAAEPGNISGDKEPHHALNNPAVDPDATEYPDPFEKRDDPRDPVDPDGAPFGEEPHSPAGAESTSEPNPGQDIEAGDRAEHLKREKLDE
jgi:hypothetical protein